ncbi:hypothetical protein [Streptosporangium sp. CA-115845]
MIRRAVVLVVCRASKVKTIPATCRWANIAHARRDLLDHDAAFAVYNI